MRWTREKRESIYRIVERNRSIPLFPNFLFFFSFLPSSFYEDRKKNKNLIRWTSHGVFFELRYWKKNSFSRGHLYVCNCIRKYGIMYSYMKFRNKTLICNFDDAIACVWPLLSRINYVPFFFFYFAIFCHQNYLVFFSTNNIRDLEKNNKICESRLKRMKLIDCVNKKANVSHDPILFLFLLFPFFSFAFSMKVNRESQKVTGQWTVVNRGKISSRSRGEREPRRQRFTRRDVFEWRLTNFHYFSFGS